MNPTKSLTVGDLIRILEALPQDIPIFVSGYESGYENFQEPKVVRLAHRPNNPFYDGEYQIAGKDERKWIDGVVLTRVNG
jgi:hypothetical protein